MRDRDNRNRICPYNAPREGNEEELDQLIEMADVPVFANYHIVSKFVSLHYLDSFEKNREDYFS